MEPYLDGEGIFKKDPSGRIWLWFSDDAFRIPVMLQTKVIFGHITARLTRYLPGQPLPSDLNSIQDEIQSYPDEEEIEDEEVDKEHNNNSDYYH